MREASEPISQTQELNKAMNKFWDIESLGINRNEISDSEIPVLEKFESEIKFREGKYEEKFPFKGNHEVLGDNFNLCKNRSKALLRKTFEKDKNLILN